MSQKLRQRVLLKKFEQISQSIWKKALSSNQELANPRSRRVNPQVKVAPAGRLRGLQECKRLDERR